MLKDEGLTKEYREQMRESTKQKQKHVLRIMSKVGINIQQASDLAGINPDTFHRWKRTDNNFRKSYEEVVESLVPHALKYLEGRAVVFKDRRAASDVLKYHAMMETLKRDKADDKPKNQSE